MGEIATVKTKQALVQSGPPRFSADGHACLCHAMRSLWILTPAEQAQKKRTAEKDPQRVPLTSFPPSDLTPTLKPTRRLRPLTPSPVSDIPRRSIRTGTSYRVDPSKPDTLSCAPGPLTFFRLNGERDNKMEGPPPPLK